MTVTAASLKAQYQWVSESTDLTDSQITGFITRAYNWVSSSFGDQYDDAVEQYALALISGDPYGFDLRPDQEANRMSEYARNYKGMARAFGAAFRTLGTG